MEAVCRNCNHWETSVPAAKKKENYGECNVLSTNGNESSMRYVLPVVDTGSARASEVLTSADFGCNQFDSL